VATDADGSYVFTDVPAGKYVAVIDPATLPPAVQQSFDLNGVFDGMTSVTLVAGVTTSAVDFG